MPAYRRAFDEAPWSGRRESNPRPTAWKAVTLPLSYSRSLRVVTLPRLNPGTTVTPAAKNLELMMGLEPMTSPLPRECSTTELHQPAKTSKFILSRTVALQYDAEGKVAQNNPRQ